MSQSRSNKGKRSQSGQQGRQASRQTYAPAGARRPTGRTPQQPQQSSFRSQIDRTLPPFSTRRYVAIWLLGMVPLALVLFLLLRPGGGAGGQESSTVVPAVTAGAGESGSIDCAAPSAPGKYFVISTAKGCIAAKLHTDASAGVSKTIANFEQKANAGELDGRTFHRVESWVIQGGDPLGNGTGGGDMPSEYNQLPFGPGALGIARGQDPAINNDSQFFITKSDASYLNGQYTNWGQVVEGQDVVNQIAIGDKMTKVRVEERK